MNNEIGTCDETFKEGMNIGIIFTIYYTFAVFDRSQWQNFGGKSSLGNRWIDDVDE